MVLAAAQYLLAPIVALDRVQCSDDTLVMALAARPVAMRPSSPRGRIRCRPLQVATTGLIRTRREHVGTETRVAQYAVDGGDRAPVAAPAHGLVRTPQESDELLATGTLVRREDVAEPRTRLVVFPARRTRTALSTTLRWARTG